MATYSYAGSLRLVLSSALTETVGQCDIVDQIVTGISNFAALSRSLSNGTGANQATAHYHDTRTVAAGANDDIVLNGTSATTDAFGRPLAFTNVKLLVVRLTSPATGQKLVLGNHPTAPWQAWFGATTHTEEVRDLLIKVSGTDGWSVSAGAPGAPASNPTMTTSGAGGAIPAATYYLETTYVSASGETIPCTTPTSVTTTGSTSTITIPSPATVTGAVGWRAYLGTSSGGPFYWQPSTDLVLPVPTFSVQTATLGQPMKLYQVMTSGPNPPATSTAYTNSVLRISNPGGGSIQYDLVCVGS